MLATAFPLKIYKLILLSLYINYLEVEFYVVDVKSRIVSNEKSFWSNLNSHFSPLVVSLLTFVPDVSNDGTDEKQKFQQHLLFDEK